MLDERKWGKMIESEVEEHHRVVTVVRSVLGFWYRICAVVPMGYETRADPLHSICTTDASPVGRLFFFWKKIIAYIFLIYLYFNRPISDSRTPKVTVSKIQGTDLP
jgi:hypothetical protein